MAVKPIQIEEVPKIYQWAAFLYKPQESKREIKVVA